MEEAGGVRHALLRKGGGVREEREDRRLHVVVEEVILLNSANINVLLPHPAGLS